MYYDFETLVSRSNTGAAKWLTAKKYNPNLSPNMVPLSIADMELKNPPEIIEGLQDFLQNGVLGYTDPTQEYLQSVVSWMKRRHNWEIKPEWIVPTSGVVSALAYSIQMFTQPGDGVLITRPVYHPFERTILLHNRKVVNSPLILDEEHRTYRIDFADLEKKASDPSTTMMILCSPHNPVGRVWTREELEQIGRICLENQVLLVVDEIHHDFVMPGHTHTVAASLSKEMADNTIICTSPGKTFNLSGMQASNIIISNEKLREKFLTARLAHGAIRLNVMGYLSCQLAYNKCENWLDQLLSLIHLNAKTVEAFVEKHLPQLKVYPLEGSYLLWVDFRGLGMNAQELEHFLKDKAQLFLDEGTIFGPEGEGFQRINLACPTQVLVDALERLKNAVDAL